MAQNAYDLQAEMALLGSVILAPNEAMACFLSVPDEAYWRPQHGALAGVIRDMLAKRKPLDAVTLYQEIEDYGLVSRIPAPYLHSILSATPTAVNCDYYAQWVMELYARRRLWETCQREQQRLDALWEAREGTEGGVTDAIARMRTEFDEIISYAGSGSTVTPMDLAELLSQPDDEFDWLVPGLLEKGDRIVVTGEEGFGKSELIAQIAVCLAAGLHPFLGDPIWDGEPAIRIAVIDCENSRGQIRRRYRRQVAAVAEARRSLGLPEVDWRKHLFIDFRTDGMNLLKGSDAAYLERFVGATAPDLLVVGPLYKLHNTDMNNEEAARGLVSVLDGIRVRHHCALLTEAHAGHVKDGEGDRMMRPRGSALFMGWPEFGFGLRRNKQDASRADLVPWRAQREQRDWPEALLRGGGWLPWTPEQAYYDRPDENWRR